MHFCSVLSCLQLLIRLKFEVVDPSGLTCGWVSVRRILLPALCDWSAGDFAPAMAGICHQKTSSSELSSFPPPLAPTIGSQHLACCDFPFFRCGLALARDQCSARCLGTVAVDSSGSGREYLRGGARPPYPSRASSIRRQLDDLCPRFLLHLSSEDSAGKACCPMASGP